MRERKAKNAMKIEIEDWDGFYENGINKDMAIKVLSRLLMAYQQSGDLFGEHALRMALEAMMKESDANVEEAEWHDINAYSTAQGALAEDIKEMGERLNNAH